MDARMRGHRDLIIICIMLALVPATAGLENATNTAHVGFVLQEPMEESTGEQRIEEATGASPMPTGLVARVEPITQAGVSSGILVFLALVVAAIIYARLRARK